VARLLAKLSTRDRVQRVIAAYEAWCHHHDDHYPATAISSTAACVRGSIAPSMALSDCPLRISSLRSYEPVLSWPPPAGDRPKRYGLPALLLFRPWDACPDLVQQAVRDQVQLVTRAGLVVWRSPPASRTAAQPHNDHRVCSVFARMP
jgi:hypothetical protein